MKAISFVYGFVCEHGCPSTHHIYIYKYVLYIHVHVRTLYHIKYSYFDLLLMLRVMSHVYVFFVPFSFVAGLLRFMLCHQEPMELTNTCASWRKQRASKENRNCRKSPK